MNASPKTALEMLQATSVWGFISAIVGSKTINMARFPQEYKAEQAGKAAKAKALGESGRGAGQGVGQQIAKKITGLSFNKLGGKLTVLLNIMDKTHRKAAEPDGKTADERGFEFAARTIADPTDKSRTIPWIEVCEKFRKWRRISTAHLPVFPALDEMPDETAETFAQDLLELRRLGVKVDKLDYKAGAVKSKIRRKKGTSAKAEDGSTANYNAPKGSTMEIQDADGQRVPGIPRKVKNRGFLFVAMPQDDASYFPADWIQDSGRYQGNLKSDPEMLPIYMAALEDAREEYVALNTKLRPWECGVIERNLEESSVTVNGVEFEVQLNEDTEYDDQPEQAKNLESGAWKQVKVPSKRGSWTLTRAKATQPTT